MYPMSTFTIPYPEYDIAEQLSKLFPKKDTYSVSIPMSRTQKFYDLIVVNGIAKKFITIQVKSSRTYSDNREEKYDYYSWLNHFDIKDNYSDFYFIYMTYPASDDKGRPRGTKWLSKILVFNNTEMKDLLDNVLTKKETNDRFFGFGFNTQDNKVGSGRALVNSKKYINYDFSKHLLENKIDEIKKSLK